MKIVYAAICVLALMVVTACSLGQTVMVSKGQAGGFAQIFSGTAEYCKVTTTPGVEITEADREALRAYCARAE